MIYYLIFTSLLGLTFVSSYALNNSINKQIAAYFLLFLGILAAVRENTGTDFGSYKSIWEGINPLNVAIDQGTGLTYLEPGFRYTVSFLKLFSDSSILFFSFFSIISIIFLLASLEYFKFNPVISIWLYFSIFYMPYIFNVIRQGLAMSIFLFSLKYILERRLIPTIFLALLATSFHITGSLILISYFLFEPLRKLKPTIFLIASTSLGSILSLLGITEQVFLFLFPGRTDSFVITNAEDTSVLQVIVRLFIILSFIFLGSFLTDANNPTYKYLINLYIFGFFIYIAFFDYNLLATRFNMFLRVIEIIIIPIFIYYSRRNITKPLVLVYYSILAFAYLLANATNPSNVYQTVF